MRGIASEKRIAHEANKSCAGQRRETRRANGSLTRGIVRAAAKLTLWLLMVMSMGSSLEVVQAGETTGELAASGPPAPGNALRAYAARAAMLRQRALQVGQVSYEEVIAAAYAPGTIDQTIVDAKERWRAALLPQYRAIADYTQSNHGANVALLVPVPDPQLQSTLVAEYEASSDTISISPAAEDFAIFHEAGHSLQRTALWARGRTSGRHADMTDVLQAQDLDHRGANAVLVRRLCYLCSQDEFEVRLEDLNRFFALMVNGRPILSATESVRALAALGLPLDYESTRQAFACAGQTLSRETFAQCIDTPTVRADLTAVPFEDARELCLIRELALQIDSSFWPRMLACIVFEAPGHL